MANETISIVYKPVATIGQVIAYHATLVYTNSAGQSFYSSAGPSKAVQATPEGERLAVLNEAGAQFSPAQGGWGTIVAATNIPFDPNGLTSIGVTRPDAGQGPFASFTVAEGTDLSGAWHTINM